MRQALWVLIAIAAFALARVGQNALRMRDSRRARESESVPARLRRGIMPEPAEDERLLTQAFGGFRHVGSTLVWLRAYERHSGGRPFAALEDGRRLLELQPGRPEVWSFVGWTCAESIASLREDPELSWPWLRTGLLTLRRGREVTAGEPGVWRLDEEEGWLLLRRLAEGPEDLRRRFMTDRELNPEGRHPVWPAIEAFERAIGDPAHDVAADLLACDAMLTALETFRLPPARRRVFLDRLATLRGHIRQAHAGPSVFQRLSIVDRRLDAVLAARGDDREGRPVEPDGGAAPDDSGR